MGLGQWAQERATAKAISLYLKPYRAAWVDVARSTGASSPQAMIEARALSLDEVFVVHRRSHVLAMRRVGNGLYDLVCEVAGVHELAGYFGDDPPLFAREFGWDAWYRAFAQCTNVLPLITEHRDRLGVPVGHEPFWTCMWAAGNANAEVRWIGKREKAARYCFARVGPHLPRLIGCTDDDVNGWWASAAMVTTDDVADALSREELTSRVAWALRQPVPELDAELDAQFLRDVAQASE
ncbi:MAG: hypothetical protein HGA44_01630 [Cellulomonadaceae bacterium]|nr:hypothetical protein [Cellulomonadaceae bacterium]